MSKERLGHLGDHQGNMATKVENYQKPTADFAESGFSRTLDYIERKNSFEGKEAKTIKKQHYKGRYS